MPRSKSSVAKNGRSRGGYESMSDHDLAEHVSDLYIHGPGGILRDKLMRREEEKQRFPTTQQENLSRLDRHPALVLNADYQPMSYLPLSMWHWQEAIKAIFSGKVTVVAVYPDVTIRAATLEIPLPSVIALNEYVPQFHQKPAFTKRNVFLRDEYRCQYCTGRFHTRDLSLDHVVPRCLGGKLTWDNAVTCCRQCNGRKGSLSVPELRSVGMKLMREPSVPSSYELAAIAVKMLPKRVHPTWEPYLGMESSLQPKDDSSRKRHHQHVSSSASSVELMEEAGL